jgi:hypothetical protein
MPRTTSHFTLQCRPEEVFDLLADVRNEPDWQPDVKSVRKLSDGEVGLGTEFEGAYRGFGTLHIRLAEYERPTRLRYDCHGPRASMDVSFDFAPASDGTDATGDIAMTLKGPWKVLTPMLAVMLPREMGKRPAQLEAALAATPRPEAAASGHRTPPG